MLKTMKTDPIVTAATLQHRAWFDAILASSRRPFDQCVDTCKMKTKSQDGD